MIWGFECTYVCVSVINQRRLEINVFPPKEFSWEFMMIFVWQAVFSPQLRHSYGYGRLLCRIIIIEGGIDR